MSGMAHFFIDIYNDSQTQPPQGFYQPKFDYHLKQHDSQTEARITFTSALFDYHLKQHDSQTIMVAM